MEGSILFNRIKRRIGRLVHPMEARVNRKLGFNNAASLRQNLIWKIYHLSCRYGYSAKGVKDDAVATAFLKDGYYVVPPTSTSRLVLDSLPENYCESRLDNTAWGLEKAPQDKSYHFQKNHFFDKLSVFLTFQCICYSGFCKFNALKLV